MPFNPFLDSLPLLDQPEALRARMQRDGYLFVAGMLPKEAVDALYEAIMAICREQGWADANNLALGEPRLEGYPEWWAVYDPLQRLEAFHAFAHRPEIRRLVEALTQEPVLVHPRNIARITFPGAAHYTTPPHQDYPLIQGTPETYTAWIPLCDCPQTLGGLAILAGSHQIGLLPVHRATGPGGLSVETERWGLTWHGQDMQAGDLLLFHSYTIHRALPNVSDRRLRVSADYRYQGVSQPVVEDSLLPHYGRMGWDEIYEGWQQEELKYYWKRLPVNIAARNFDIMQPVETR
jgi:hypothetical protein